MIENHKVFCKPFRDVCELFIYMSFDFFEVLIWGVQSIFYIITQNTLFLSKKIFIITSVSKGSIKTPCGIPTMTSSHELKELLALSLWEHFVKKRMRWNETKGWDPMNYVKKHNQPA